MEEPIELLISEIREWLDTLESSLPGRVDPIALSHSKLPFKALVYREVRFEWQN